MASPGSSVMTERNPDADVLLSMVRLPDQGGYLEAATTDPEVLDGLLRLARLARRPLWVRAASGRVLLAAGTEQPPPAALAEAPLELGGVRVGTVATAAEAGQNDDVLPLAVALIGQRLRRESETSALTDELLGRLQELALFQDGTARLASAPNRRQLATTLIELTRDLIDTDWAACLHRIGDKVRVLAVSSDEQPGPTGWRALPSGSLLEQALDGRGVIVAAQLTPEARQGLTEVLGPVAAAAGSALLTTLPWGEGEALLVGLRGPESPAFDSVTAQRLDSLASQASTSGGRLDLREESRELFLSTIWTLTSAIDAKDPVTHGHGRRTGRLAAAVGRELGMTPGAAERLELAALLHDIGKLAVPESILNKGACLSRVEVDQLRLHSEQGAEILSPLRALEDIVPAVLHHHERMDGRGYPHGLAGEGIPLGARIIAVVDAFDAMLADRPPRPALRPDEAAEELDRCAGTQFDPAVVSAFLGLLSRGSVRLEGR
ncbi:MAG: HD-GYP domain-containing protein [Acidobacteriota bacterium]